MESRVRLKTAANNPNGRGGGELEADLAGQTSRLGRLIDDLFCDTADGSASFTLTPPQSLTATSDASEVNPAQGVCGSGGWLAASRLPRGRG